jgi:DNA modification methylase
MTHTILQGDTRLILPTLTDQSVQCVVTSPPYFGLRDYGMPNQIGVEPTLQEFVEAMVAVFREVRRVLKDDGVLFLNLGDTIVAKQLQGIPWRVALALQADGWYLRQDIIWHKPNPMPESVKDRCTKAHEYVFLLSKSPKYLFNWEAIAEPIAESSKKRYQHAVDTNEQFNPEKHKHTDGVQSPMELLTRAAKGVLERGVRNRRSVWKIATQSFEGAHFATFPLELPTLCIKAGSNKGDTILDPFNGAATTGIASQNLERNYIGIELNPEYVKLSQTRLDKNAANIVPTLDV